MIGENAVLMSIHEKWCSLILSGEKIIEVRKRKPALKPPFKCYCYETSSNGRGLVVGEFVCFDVWDIFIAMNRRLKPYEIAGTCLTDIEIMDYVGCGKTGYGLLISEPRKYADPIPVQSFRKICSHELYCESCGMYNNYERKCGNESLYLKRPPQSWCYVKELHKEA